MDGFLLAFKEKGISSNQVVQQTKRLFSLKKVGHLGTLDPMAEGLLVLAVNRATRFSSFFLESDKKYENVYYLYVVSLKYHFCPIVDIDCTISSNCLKLLLYDSFRSSNSLK